MKKLLFFAFLIGCNSNGYCKEFVKLHGTILHPLADSVKITYAFTSIKYEPIVYTSKIDKDGRFAVEFEVRDGYTQIDITNGKQRTELFAAPGTDLTITLDGNNFDSSLHYEGKGKEIANFMARRIVSGHDLSSFVIQSQKLCAKDPAGFVAAIKELRNKEIAFMRDNGKDLPVSFKERCEAEYGYSMYSGMQIYPRIHEVYRQKTNNVKDIPKENYVVMKEVPAAFNDEHLGILSYQSYLTNYYSSKVSCKNAANGKPTDGFTDFDSLLAFTFREMPPKSAEFMGGRNIFYSIKVRPAKEMEQAFETYKTHYPRSKNIPILEDAIALKKNMGSGKPEIDFDITTPEGKQMKLSDLKGKVVYLDFWERGCMPCIAEMPDAKKIRGHYEGQPVAFVYVSLDTDDDKWIKAIKDLEIEGINTRLEGKFESSVAKKYGVMAIPSHFLIDKEGKFAPYEVIERPTSSEKLIAQIDKLLN